MMEQDHDTQKQSADRLAYLAKCDEEDYRPEGAIPWIVGAFILFLGLIYAFLK